MGSWSWSWSWNGQPSATKGERTALLSSVTSPHGTTTEPPKATPLPSLQILILCLMRLGEPIAFTLIFPFVVAQVTDSGVTSDPRRVGYYAGVIEALFAASTFVTVIPWGRLSDRIGRRPVLIMGLSGVCLSVVSFGLSKSFTTMVISRCLGGALNGNVAVIKSTMSEITDETNQARAFSLLPLAWSIGSVIGPLLGGYLSHPATNFPSVFGNIQFFIDHPYSLPCFIGGTAPFLGAILGIFFLQESLPSRPTYIAPPPDLIKIVDLRRRAAFLARTSTTVSIVVPSRALTPAPQRTAGESDLVLDKPPPFSDLYTKRIFGVLLVYAFLALETVALDAILIIFCSTSVKNGGLGFTSSDVGRALSFGGILTVAVQIILFPILQRKWGTANLYRAMMSLYPITFLILPLMSVLVSIDIGSERTKKRVWGTMLVFLTFKSIANMAYGANMLAVNTAVPSRRLLGSMNGLAQSTSALMRAIGPVAASSLFAFSITHDVAKGFLVFWVWSFIAVLGAGSTIVLQEGTSWRDAPIERSEMENGDGSPDRQ